MGHSRKFAGVSPTTLHEEDDARRVSRDWSRDQARPQEAAGYLGQQVNAIMAVAKTAREVQVAGKHEAKPVAGIPSPRRMR